MFGVSELEPATSFALSDVAAKVRTAAREQLEAWTTAPNGRPAASLRAIAYGLERLGLDGSVRRGKSRDECIVDVVKLAWHRYPVDSRLCK